MTTTTPGPWVFAYGAVYREDTLHDENSIRVALMDRDEPHTAPVERDNNARLIAAAPELAEALKAVLKAAAAHRWMVNSDEQDVFAEAKAVLAKAVLP